MLDYFKDKQSIAYNLLVNSVANNKLGHAYLIDGNDNEYGYDFVMAFVKMIVCDKHYCNNNLCDNCNICSRIDEGNYTEVKVIETDSMIIKKEQLLELQSEFSRTSIEGAKRVYVIKDCEKMNKQASNSLLKFLEEPTSGIVAILFTNNINKVLPTIISRCQLIKLEKTKINNNERDTFNNFAYFCCDSREEIDKFLADDDKRKYIDNVVYAINYYEENGLDIMIYLKKIWFENFKDRNDNVMALLLMVNFYYDVLKFKNNIDDYFFNDYMENIERVSNCNFVDKIIKKINVCIEISEYLKYNLNVNLLIDSLFIRLGE